MKHFSFAFCLLPGKMNAQIKVFSAGKVTIGGTTAPNSAQHQIVGDKVVFSATSSTITSAPLIRGQNSFSSNSPGYTWWGDDATGIGHPSAGHTSFIVNGVEAARIDNNSKFYIGSYNTTYPALLNINSTVNGLQTLNTVHTVSSDWAPSQINHVNRTLTKAIVVTHNNSDKFYVRGDGVVWANSYQTWSDSTLKEDIRPIPSALSLLQGMRGVTYTFKQETLKPNALPSTYIPAKSNKRTYGLIAQELETVLPEAVETDEKGIKSITYTSLIPVLIESLKELKAEVDILKGRLTECCQRKSDN